MQSLWPQRYALGLAALREATFSLGAEADVVLSLQASPHPSHPPLEAAISGAYSVTNEIDPALLGAPLKAVLPGVAERLTR